MVSRLRPVRGLAALSFVEPSGILLCLRVLFAVVPRLPFSSAPMLFFLPLERPFGYLELPSTLLLRLPPPAAEILFRRLVVAG